VVVAVCVPFDPERPLRRGIGAATPPRIMQPFRTRGNSSISFVEDAAHAFRPAGRGRLTSKQRLCQTGRVRLCWAVIVVGCGTPSAPAIDGSPGSSIDDSPDGVSTGPGIDYDEWAAFCAKGYRERILVKQ
jgi:hypothetical protein